MVSPYIGPINSGFGMVRSGLAWLGGRFGAAAGGLVSRSVDLILKHPVQTTCNTAQAALERSCATVDRTVPQVCNAVEKINNRICTAMEESAALGIFTFCNTLRGCVKLLIGIVGASATPYVIHGTCMEDSVFCSTVLKTAQCVSILAGAGCLYLLGKECKTYLSQQDTQGQTTVAPKAHRALIGPSLAPCLDSSALMQAAHVGDVTMIQKLQKEGVFLDAHDVNGKTALHWAAIGRQKKAIEQLWFYGCDLTKSDHSHALPIHYLEPASELYVFVDKLTKTPNRFALAQPFYLFYPPENLVFKGGGPKGIAYVGIQKFLEEHNLLCEVRRIAGTSAGAINAVLVALGYNAASMQSILQETDLISLLDHDFTNEQETVQPLASVVAKKWEAPLKDYYLAIKNFILHRNTPTEEKDLGEKLKEICAQGGLCKGAKILDWIESLIEAKTGIKHCTFGEFREMMSAKGFKHIYLFATNLQSTSTMQAQDTVCINSEDPKWDHIVISDAVRASISIPGVFQSYVLRIKPFLYAKPEAAPQLGKFIDGGILKNFPIDTFDCNKYRVTNLQCTKAHTNHQTLAFNLHDPPSADFSEPKTVTSLLQVLLATGATFRNGEEIALANNPNHKPRIINISNMGIGLVTGFFADQKEKDSLIQSGYRSITQFFEQQEALAAQHKDWDPSEILSIQPRSLVQVISAPPSNNPIETTPVLVDTKETDEQQVDQPLQSMRETLDNAKTTRMSCEAMLTNARDDKILESRIETTPVLVDTKETDEQQVDQLLQSMQTNLDNAKTLRMSCEAMLTNARDDKILESRIETTPVLVDTEETDEQQVAQLLQSMQANLVNAKTLRMSCEAVLTNARGDKLLKSRADGA